MAGSTSYLPTVVGIGASAGGLEALQGLLGALSKDVKAAFVVVQHLSPDHPSLLKEILEHHTELPLHTAEDGMDLEAGHIYLVPPAKSLLCESFCLRVADSGSRIRGEPNRSVDALFESMANSLGARAVAVVLSGTGTDGTFGAAAVLARGGQVFVQSPASAGFDGMPASAIEAGVADFVGAPEDLARVLQERVKDSQTLPLSAQAYLQDESDRIERLFELLVESYGVDFRNYKPATIMRRTLRRMSLTQSPNLAAYLERLQDPEELNRFYNDLLLDVTEFFRDGPMWNRVRDEVIAPWTNDPKRERRIWVCGCSSGEEAYTAAMLVAETFEVAHGSSPPLRIFATDVSRKNLERASTGIYSAEAVARLSLERRERFFVQKDSVYQVRPELRRTVVFVPHDVTQQTPFNRMDLVTCRNMLIYMQPEQQRRVVSIFHYALWPRGALFLGSAEGILNLTDRFAEIDAHARLFRVHGRIRPRYEEELTRSPNAPSHTVGAAPKTRARSGRQDLSDELVTAALAATLHRGRSSGVVVGKDNALLHVVGRPPDFLRPPSGLVSFDVNRMLPHYLGLAVRSALHQARETGDEVTLRSVRLGDREEDGVIDLHVCPLGPWLEGMDADVVLFAEPEAETEVSGEAVDYSKLARGRIAALEAELHHSREHLQAVVEELETNNEEQQAANEELLATNEELQSANEEMSSLNEELHTINAEYKNKIQELLDLNADVNSLLDTLDVGVVFLDEDFRVLRFNEAATQVFRLTLVDLGRPLAHLTDSFQSSEDRIAITSCLKEKQRTTRVVRTMGGWWRVVVMPVEAPDGVSRSLLTLVDITEITSARAELARQSALLDSLAHRLPDVLWVIGADGRYEYISEAYERMCGVSVEEVRANPARFADQLHPEDRERVVAEVDRGLTGDGFDTTYRIVRPDGEKRWLRSRGIPWLGEAGVRLGTVGVIQDVGEQIRMAADEASARTKLEEIIASLGKVPFEMNLSTERVEWDEDSLRVFGTHASEMGQSVDEFCRRIHPRDTHFVLSPNQVEGVTGAVRNSVRFRTAGGGYVWMETNAFIFEKRGARFARGTGRLVGPSHDPGAAAAQAALAATWAPLEPLSWSYDTWNDTWHFDEDLLAEVGTDDPRAHLIAEIEEALHARLASSDPLLMEIAGKNGPLLLAAFKNGEPDGLVMKVEGLAVRRPRPGG